MESKGVPGVAAGPAVVVVCGRDGGRRGFVSKRPSSSDVKIHDTLLAKIQTEVLQNYMVKYKEILIEFD